MERFNRTRFERIVRLRQSSAFSATASNVPALASRIIVRPEKIDRAAVGGNAQVLSIVADSAGAPDPDRAPTDILDEPPLPSGTVVGAEQTDFTAVGRDGQILSIDRRPAADQNVV